MRISWIASRTKKCVLDQIELKLSLETKMTKPRLSYFRKSMRRQEKKAMTLGKVEDNRKRGRQNKRWIKGSYGLKFAIAEQH